MGTSQHRGGAPDWALITSAPESREQDLNRRQGQYIVMMTIRVAFFLLAVFVPGPLRWVFLVCSAVIPGIAVVIANAVDLRQKEPGRVPEPDTDVPEPPPAPALSRAPLVIPGEASALELGAPDHPGHGRAEAPDRKPSAPDR